MKNILDKHIKAYEGQNLYDFDNNILLNWYPNRIIKFSSDAKSILELGLGHGFTTKIFSEYFSHHVVLDGSKAVIKNFKKRNPDCPALIIETYFEKFESDEKFDVIVLGFILEHVDNPLAIITRYRNFLSPAGTMFIAVPNAQVLNRRLGHLIGMLPDIHSLSENDILLGHKRYYTVNSLTEDVKSAGLEIERMEGIYLKPFTSSQLISLNFDKEIFNALCEVGIDYPELSCGILAQLKEA
jgi:2-polyprenyl-3-methyl-5-hydroxy-6-metoxy-1,4-benzoquinol methylase